MSKSVLMLGKEPSDHELSELMKEVAMEAKHKAIQTQRQLKETIKQLIGLAAKKL